MALKADLLVVGTGLAGLAAAYEAAAAGARVVVATMGARGDGASALAQGGIAVPVDAGDVALHIRDTLVAGRGVCDPAAVRSIVKAAPAARDWLRARGARFDRGFAREGGHSRARILHRDGDRTGAHLVACVAGALMALPRPPTVLERHRAVSLCLSGGRVTGALLRHGRRTFRADAGAVILATGGLGRLYARTTNPPGTCGAGVALGLLAGAVVRDMEFVQFHPTVLADGGLVSEALRGAGARLVNGKGEYFMERYAPAADLTPRDVVSRAVRRESILRGPVCLDLRGVAALPERFPGLAARLAALGYRPGDDPVPVTPAAHYAVGGLKTDAEGRTTVPGLYAAGEVASTGMHGANRLASNSMLEAVIMGRRAARAGLWETGHGHAPGQALPVYGLAAQYVEGLPREMDLQAGISRETDNLRALGRRLESAWNAAGRGRGQTAVAHRVLAALMVVRGALERDESCGVHWRGEGVPVDAPPYHVEQWLDGCGADDPAALRPGSAKRPVAKTRSAPGARGRESRDLVS